MNDGRLLSRVQPFGSPWTLTHQAPSSMGFSRQEYWSGLPFPSPGDLPNPGIKLRSPALQADASTSEPLGKPCYYCCYWVTSVVSDSVRPHRQQPTRLPRPWDSPGKNTGVGCHFLLQRMKVKSESELVQSCLTLKTPWTTAHQTPPSMGFSRQEYWSGVPLPSLREALVIANSSDCFGHKLFFTIFEMLLFKLTYSWFII